MKKKTSKRDMKFTKRATVYDAGFEGRLSEQAYKLVTGNVDLIQGYKVLDVGCGTGTILKRLNDISGIEGFGIDMEEKMIEKARKKCPQMKIEKSDCCNTSFEDETFDIVIACMAFHHFYDQTAFAEEVSRILKKGGKLYIVDPDFSWLLRKIINTIINWHGLVGKFGNYKEILQIFQPYNLIGRATKRRSFFRLIVLERR